MTAPTFVESAREALAGAMSDDDGVLVLGEDVAPGGPFGFTKGLAATFGEARVRNTPISEGAVMGVAIGLALAGRRPVVDLMFNDFLTAASDQLFNHAAKIHYMGGGRYSVPITVWTIGGAGTRWGAHHSQRLDGWLAQVPGIKVVAPASPGAAAAAITEAIADPDPVVVFADRALLYSREPLPGEGGSPWRSRIVRSGKVATIVTTGRLVHAALRSVTSSGIDAEIIDVQCLAPLRIDEIAESIERTSRLLVVHDEAGVGSMAASIVSRVQAAAFWNLEAPIAVLTSPPTPVPAAPALEDAYMIGDDDIADALRGLIAK